MRSVLSNFLALVFSNVFALGLNFVYSIIIVTKLADAYGLQSAILSFAAIVTGISYLGLLEVGTRELARRPAQDHAALYGNLMALHLTLSGTTCLLSIAFVLIAHSFTGDAFLVFLLALFTLVFSFAPTVPTEALLIARGKMKTVALLQSFYAAATTIFGGFIVLLQTGNVPQLAGKVWGITSITQSLLHGYSVHALTALYMVLSIVSVVTIILYLYEARRTLGMGFRLRLKPDESIFLLRHGFPGGIAATFYTFCMRFGAYFVFIYIGDKEAAYLGVSSLALQAVTSIVWIPYSINILPIMTRIHMTSSVRLKWIGSRSLTMIIAVTVPIAVGTTLMANDVLSFLSKMQTVAGPTLRVFIWILPLAVVASFSYWWLLILSKQHAYLLATAAGAVVNLLACIVLVPSGAAVGAAWAAVVSLLTVDIVCLWSLRSWVREDLRLLDVFRILTGIAGMVVSLQLTVGWAPILRIIVGALVYGAILFVSGILPIHELKTFRTLFVQNAGASN